MEMSKEQIVREYQQMRDPPSKRINILAELNACRKMDITQILLDAGEQVPCNYLPKPKRAEDQEDHETPAVANQEPEKHSLTVAKLMELLKSVPDPEQVEVLINDGGVRSVELLSVWKPEKGHENTVYIYGGE